MNKEHIFWIDPNSNVKKTYQDLLNDILKVKSIPIFLDDTDPYLFFVNLIASVLCEIDIDVIDSNLSLSEKENLGFTQEIDFKKEVKVTKVLSDDLKTFFIPFLKGEFQWKMGLFTSGTTGRPKRVEHVFSSLTRAVKINHHHSDDIWALAYSPTHFAGLQVFLQAFLNRNPIVYLFKSKQNCISEQLRKYKITHLSATPTFYRSFLFSDSKTLTTVRNITMGGEKFDNTLQSDIKKIFPTAKIKNIYASSEAGSLFTSNNDVFSIPSELEEKIQISDNGELLVHKDLLGISNNMVLQNDWYYTGDIVKKVSSNTFCFISRKNEMINVGGYKVNPNEVESLIKKITGVKDVIVYGRTNKLTGSIVVADIVLFDSKDSKRIEVEVFKLTKKLQGWKVPRLVKFVENLSITRTGKKERK